MNEVDGAGQGEEKREDRTGGGYVRADQNRTEGEETGQERAEQELNRTSGEDRRGQEMSAGR